jgi:integrase
MTIWIFPSPLKLGRLPYSYSGFRDELARAGKRSRVGHIGTHTFRHSFRMWIDAAGTTVGVTPSCAW